MKNVNYVVLKWAKILHTVTIDKSLHKPFSFTSGCVGAKHINTYFWFYGLQCPPELAQKCQTH